MIKLLPLLLLLAACSIDPNIRRPGNVPDDMPGAVTKVWNADGWGTGAIIGTNLVATVAHVSDGDGPTWACGDEEATEVLRIPSVGHEEIVILRVDFDYEPEQIFLWNPGGEAYTSWTWQQGRVKLVRDNVIAGDSGSPVLDRDGKLVGHISACRL